MEFWGFIYIKGEVIKDFFHPNGYSSINDYSINSNEIKKYYINGKWILSGTLSYLESLNIKPYISRSESFAKILFSSKNDLLKFDYLEKGKFKKQLVIEKGSIKNIIGFDRNIFSSKTTTEIFFELIKSDFGLDKDFIETKPEYFINERKENYKMNFWDYATAYVMIRGIILLFFLPIFCYYGILILTEAIVTDGVQSVPLGIYVFFFGCFASMIYFGWFIYSEIKNYLLIKYKVLDDEIITLPNKA